MDVRGRRCKSVVTLDNDLFVLLHRVKIETRSEKNSPREVSRLTTSVNHHRSRISIGKSCRSQAERLKILSPSFLRGSIECFPGGSILNNIKFSQWLNIAQQKVFQVAHSSTLLEIRVPLTEGDTIFCLNVTALNKGALYEPSLNHS